MFNEAIFKKVITYKLNIDLFYRDIENLDYFEYMKYRSDFLQFVVAHLDVPDNPSAKDKYWSRLIAKIKEQYKYVVPISNSQSAINKRYQRKG